jgi:hypothetical protein
MPRKVKRAGSGPGIGAWPAVTWMYDHKQRAAWRYFVSLPASQIFAEDYVAASGGHEVAVWARLWGTAPDFQIAIGNDSNSDSHGATSFNNVSTEPGPGGPNHQLGPH